MAKKAKGLTPRQVLTLKEPGRHADGDNLYLMVRPSGAKCWTFFYRSNGKMRELGLGSAAPGHVTLAEARDKAIDARRLLAQGIDPIDRKRGDDAAKKTGKVTFGECADEFIRLHEGEWRNEKHRAQWRSTMSDNYIRDLRRRPVADVTTEDVLAVIKPLWNTKRETASRMRQRIQVILDAATVENKRSGPNPAAWSGHLERVLPPHGKGSKKHHSFMPWQKVPAFIADLEMREGVAARAVEFLILTAARSNEVRRMVWRDVDLDAKLWVVPSEKMKKGREHRVPLSDRAVEVVRSMLPLRSRRDPDDALVFPGLRHASMSDMTLGAVLKRMKVTDVTIHGFRTSFRTWAGEETSASVETMEAALSHAPKDATIAAYARSDWLEKRRALMQQWADFISAPPSKTPTAAEGAGAETVA